MWNTFLLFVVNYINFTLFFFTVPYMTGKQIVELSGNGIYKGAITGCTNLGHAIYRAIEETCRAIARAFDFHPQSMFYSLMNIGFYVVAVSALNSCYNFTMELVINYEPEQFKWVADSSYSKLSDVLLVFNIVGQFLAIDSFWQIFPAIIKSVFAVMFFLALTVLHFSVMVGLLEFKTEELHPLTGERAPNRERMLLAMNKDLDPNVGISWVGKGAQGLLRFIDDTVRLRNFEVKSCKVWFVGCLVCWCIVSNAAGAMPDFVNLLLDVLDESDLLNTFVSFLLSAVLMKGTLKTCKAVYNRMPEGTKAKVDKIEAKCTAVVSTVKAKRIEWAESKDGVYTESEGLTISWTPRPLVKAQEDRDNCTAVQNVERASASDFIKTRGQATANTKIKEGAMSIENTKFVTSVEEAYATGKDYYDGARWTYLKGCLVDLGFRGDTFKAMSPEGVITEHSFDDNEWGITAADRKGNNFGL